MIEVLQTGLWSFGGGVYIGQKQLGQITKCRLEGLVFYVRENLNGADSFFVPSNQRWGEKGGNDCTGGPRPWRQILDLCCPPEHFAALAAAVQAADPLQRPVRSHRCFTAQWAEAALRHDVAR